MFRPQTGSQEEAAPEGLYGLNTIPEDDAPAPTPEAPEPEAQAEAEPEAEAAAEEPAAEEPAAKEPAAEEPAVESAGDFKVGPGGAKLYTFENWRARGHHF